MSNINPEHIELIDNFHNPLKKAYQSNNDNRSIIDYDRILNACSNFQNLDKLIENMDFQEINWIDYCCGKGRAIIEGTNRINKKNNQLVSSLGVDIRKFDFLDYQDSPVFIQGKVNFYSADLEQGLIVNLKPQLITCIKGLLYTTNPLSLFENMFNQLDAGGKMLVTINPGNDVNHSMGMGTNIVDNLERFRIKYDTGYIENEFAILVEKQNNGFKSLNFNLELDRYFRNPITGWTTCHYIDKE
ncbi:MAG: hypothetical protein WC867_05780 [Candidatus Pacearchaeota archaeon]|jgi:hypothetical protein